MTTNDPDRIRADIERTRAELSYDVDALGDKVSPGSIAHRQATKVRAGATSLKSRVMGTARDAAHKVSDTAGDVSSSSGDALSSAGDAVTGLPHTVARQTEGNPLAAGLIAFGVGWLASSLVPATKPEQRAALAVKEQAADLTEEAKATASEVAQHLKDPALEAGQAVKDAATQAAEQLKEHGSQAASDLKDEAVQAKENVQETRQ
ncbi:hypothetical protein CELL_02109 [Cellulomonas sp. T2.31MG-18]|uniref:DUF3618 domain-containing protein n=1 Tax=Cellulomonas sp. T2.31MG-18 TaxID=3157619 RepID=UPI0035EA149B